MNKFSVYVLLILIYLGLSRSFAPLEKGTIFIPNERVFTNYFLDSPISVVLVDSFQTGFLIKTYFQKYYVIHGFKQPETLIVKTTKEFWNKNKGNIGMSIYRKGDGEENMSSTPAPPGTLYLGDPSYGNWRMSNSGKKFWKFHRAYKNFPALFRWGSFRPSEEFYKKLEIFLKNNKPFYGLENEFGSDGTITKKYYISKLSNQKNKFDFKGHLLKYFTLEGHRRETNE